MTPTTPAPNTPDFDLYVVDPDTGSADPFLSSSGSQTNAEVSPDGKRVVYEGHVPGVSPQIFVLEPDGSTRQLTRMKGGASDPAWSPDGTEIAFAGTRRQDGDRHPDADIFVAETQSGRIRRLTGTSRDDGHPNWSPDGSRIVFHSRYLNEDGLPAGWIWVASVSTRALTRLIGSRWSAFTDPAWSPDGRWIAYGATGVTVNGRPMTTWLQLMRPNGSYGGVVRESGSFGIVENPSWSPDGRSIVFEENHPAAGMRAVGMRWEGAVGNIGIADVDGEELRWIAKGATSDQPSWGQGGILVSLAPGASGAMPRTTLEAEWTSSWTPPDATVVLGDCCEVDADSGRVVGGVVRVEGGDLRIRFVNNSDREWRFKVVRMLLGQELLDLRAGPFMGRGWRHSTAPESTDVWSSSRPVTSGRWAVVCFKDIVSGVHGFTLVPAGVAGPLEVGIS